LNKFILCLCLFGMFDYGKENREKDLLLCKFTADTFYCFSKHAVGEFMLEYDMVERASASELVAWHFRLCNYYVLKLLLIAFPSLFMQKYYHKLFSFIIININISGLLDYRTLFKKQQQKKVTIKNEIQLFL
jgi:hypothetical protein